MTRRGPLILGIDCGTQSLRAAVFDLAGACVGSAARPLPVDYPRVSWAEQRPEDWWEAAKEAVPRALAEGGVRAEEIAGVSLDCTSCTVVAARRDGTPLRPAILWMDQRAHEEAEEIGCLAGWKPAPLRPLTPAPLPEGEGNGIAQARSPAPRGRSSAPQHIAGWKPAPRGMSAEWMLPKALWLRRHEPRTFEEADYIVEGLDWLTHRLAGEWALSLNNVTCRWNYAAPEGGWSAELLAQVGLAELPEKWPDTILPMGARVGELTREAAEALGLPPGIPVAESGIDAYTSMLGVGAVRPGRMALVMGSSTCHLALSDRALCGSRLWGPFPDCLLPGTWVLEGGQTATGAIVKWLADNLAGGAMKRAETEGVDVYEVLDREAAEVGVGSEGLVLLDYFQGNRTPIGDPLARGAIWGLSLKHGAPHLLRAIYEGTAFGTRLILDDMRRAGFEPEGIHACGGGARSSLWLQIHADVCRTPIHLTQEPGASALGTAVCAAVGAGLFADLREAAEAMTRVTRTIEPDGTSAAAHDFGYDKYLRTYAALKDLMHEVAGREGRQSRSG